jgi:hypothetical protein
MNRSNLQEKKGGTSGADFGDDSLPLKCSAGFYTVFFEKKIRIAPGSRNNKSLNITR